MPGALLGGFGGIESGEGRRREVSTLEMSAETRLNLDQ